MLLKALSAFDTAVDEVAHAGPLEQVGDTIASALINGAARWLTSGEPSIEYDSQTVRYYPEHHNSAESFEDGLYKIGTAMGTAFALVALIGAGLMLLMPLPGVLLPATPAFVGLSLGATVLIALTTFATMRSIKDADIELADGEVL